MSKKFEFENKLKTSFIIMMAVGVLGMIWAYFWNHGFNSNARFWSNILLNTYYFAGIAVTGIFFITAHHLGYSGWQTVLKKIPMAMSKFLYIVFPIMVVITIATLFVGEDSAFYSNIYTHWASEHGMADLIVQEKAPFLSPSWYAVIVLGFFGLWALFARLMYTKFMSIKNLKEYGNTKALAAAFLVIFGVSSSVLSWIVIMSIDPHWYSTLFGWYNLMGYFAAGMSMMVLIIIFLKSKGHLPHVYEDHIHDIAKYIFGFSVFWTYLWFSQFMLIWFANIPEATIWYNKRWDLPLFKFIFFFGVLINFVIPLLMMLARNSKRNFKIVSFCAVLIIVGHYLDFYQMIMLEPMNVPHQSAHGDDGHALNSNNILLLAEHHTEEKHDEHATDSHETETHTDHSEESHTVNTEKHDTHADKSHTNNEEEAHGDNHSGGHHDKEATNLASIGLPEIFIFIGFLGLFLYMTFSALAKEDDLEVTEDPYLKESVNHHFDW